jgi:hypothetical protein
VPPARWQRRTRDHAPQGVEAGGCEADLEVGNAEPKPRQSNANSLLLVTFPATSWAPGPGGSTPSRFPTRHDEILLVGTPFSWGTTCTPASRKIFGSRTNGADVHVLIDQGGAGEYYALMAPDNPNLAKFNNYYIAEQSQILANADRAEVSPEGG